MREQTEANKRISWAQEVWAGRWGTSGSPEWGWPGAAGHSGWSPQGHRSLDISWPLLPLPPLTLPLPTVNAQALATASKNSSFNPNTLTLGRTQALCGLSSFGFWDRWVHRANPKLPPHWVFPVLPMSCLNLRKHSLHPSASDMECYPQAWWRAEPRAASPHSLPQSWLHRGLDPGLGDSGGDNVPSLKGCQCNLIGEHRSLPQRALRLTETQIRSCDSHAWQSP